LKQTLVLAGAVAAAFVLGGCGHTTPITSGTATPSPTYSPNVSSEYTIPTANSQPAGITRTSTALWFAEEGANKLGTLSQAAVITDYPLPNANSKPLSLIIGQDGNLWLTEFGGGRIATFNVATLGFKECTLSPAPTSATPTPWGIAAGQDGNLWVTDPASNGIWVIQPGCGMYAFYPLKTANADPTAITVGPDTALWFVEAGADKIGRIPIGSASGTMPTEYPVSTGAGLGVIVSGADNALWFTETKSNKLGRMLTTGALGSETPLTGVGSPYGLVLGPDGNFYLGDQTKSAIVQYVTATGAINSYPTKTANAGPFWLTIGPDNEVYFTEQTANQIGQFLYFNP
jgi:virginiamycin B lyase